MFLIYARPKTKTKADLTVNMNFLSINLEAQLEIIIIECISPRYYCVVAIRKIHVSRNGDCTELNLFCLLFKALTNAISTFYLCFCEQH